MIFIYVPCQSVDEAKTIAKVLVQKKLAGRVDIMPTESLYQRGGEVQEVIRATMVIMTIDKRIQDIEDTIHEYFQNRIPCIASLSLYRLNRDFKDWLITATN
jgi:periplasmic divalent cation tolerance protein